MDVREALQTLADAVPPEGDMPAPTRRRAHRRRAMTASVSALAVLAVAVGSWTTIASIGRPDRTVPPAGEQQTVEVAKLETFGNVGPIVLDPNGDGVFVAASPVVYRLGYDGTTLGQWRFGNEPLSGNAPPFATIRGLVAAKSGAMFVAYSVISKPDGKDPCGREPFEPGSATGCGRVAIIDDGKVTTRATLDEPPTGAVAGDGSVWVSGVTRLYDVPDGTAVARVIALPKGLRARSLHRGGDRLYVQATGANSDTHVLVLDAKTGSLITRRPVPAAVVGVAAGSAWGSAVDREGPRTIAGIFRLDPTTLEPAARHSLATSFAGSEGEGSLLPHGPIHGGAHNVWVGSPGGVVTRVDPSNGRPVGSLWVGEHVGALLENGSRLWTLSIYGSVTRTAIDRPVTTFASPAIASDYVRPSGPEPGSRSLEFLRVDVIGDDRRLIVRLGLGACDRLTEVRVTESADHVVIDPHVVTEPAWRVATNPDVRTEPAVCPGILLLRQTSVTLVRPLGDRIVVASR